jgi:hypothetical protein
MMEIEVSEMSVFNVDVAENSRTFYCILMVVKRTVLWDITPCSPSQVNRRFG